MGAISTHPIKIDRVPQSGVVSTKAGDYSGFSEDNERMKIPTSESNKVIHSPRDHSALLPTLKKIKLRGMQMVKQRPCAI
jgi:hypothetical protein